LSQGQLEMIIVGTGTNGAEYIAPKAGSRASGNSISSLIELSQDAVAKVNEPTEQKKKVAALIHMTC
jgi:hypothetical protein